MQFRLEKICNRVGGRVDGDGGVGISGVNALETAGPDEITFAESDRYLDQVRNGTAAAVIVGEDFPELPGRNLLRAINPRLAFVQVMGLFVPPPESTGIHADASIAEDAELGEGVSVGACAVVAGRVCIGARTIIEPGAYVGPGVVIGEDCLIEANAVLMQGVRLGNRVIIHAGATIGGEGFGFVWMGDHHHKVPQLGTVHIEDDVEIGCNSCVDRATMGVTRIGRGTKIDNQVHLAHNNDIGEDVIIAGQGGTSGSVTIGNRAVLGGRVAVADHLKIGEGAQIGGGTGVTCNIKPGETVWGFPSRPMKRVLREQASLARLPDALKVLKKQSKELEELKARLALLEGAAKDPA